MIGRRNCFLFLRAFAITMCPAALLAQNWQSAVTMDHEPHHHLAFQNQYLRAFQVEVPPHSSTLLHQHAHDYVFVTLGDTSLENDVQGKPPAKLDLKDGDVRFTKGGFAHIAKNLSAKPFRNITVEFLQPIGDPKPPETTEQPGPGTACRFAGVMFPAMIKVLYSSEVLNVRDYSLPRKCGVSPEGKGALVVALSAVVVNHSAGPSKALKRGDLAWVSSRDAIVNRHGIDARFIAIEFEK
jgi:quercetin dioxygenase-like cupin family protein